MRNTLKIGRNDPCPCGSGKKSKKCCASNAQSPEKKSIIFNKHFNRFESTIDHHYLQFTYDTSPSTGLRSCKGKVKCRLVHMLGNSIIVPDLIFLNNGQWIQPLFFSPPLIMQLEEDTYVCDFIVDIQNGKTIRLRFFNTGLIKAYDDRSQIYHCDIYGPADDEINDYGCGEYYEKGDKMYTKLYHHTDDKGFEGITQSKCLWSSPWNYRGSKQCANASFVYFTHIPEIKFNSDLITVAMSSDGPLRYTVDSFVTPKVVTSKLLKFYDEFIYTAHVYRSTSANRNRAIAFYVPIEAIDVKHIYMHYQSERFFYELCFPYIHRLKTVSMASLAFDNDYHIKAGHPLLHSDYAIVGDAQTKKGLAAPFEEEETKYIFKIEDCDGKSIHEFWFSNANQDLFTSKKITVVNIKDIPDNPASTS